MNRYKLLLALVCVLTIALPWGNSKPEAPRTYADHNLSSQPAIFAGGVCANPCAITISGSGATVIGGTHSNGCTAVSADGSFPPPNSVANPDSPSPMEPEPDVVPLIPMPIYYTTTQFDDASDPFVIAAGANYYHITGSVTLPSATAGANKVTDAQMQNALIYVNGDVTLQASAFLNSSYNFTIVATGEIGGDGHTITNKTFSSYLDDVMGDPNYSLLFFTSKNTNTLCTPNALGISLSFNNVIFNGGFYVPYAGLFIKGTDPQVFGYLAGRLVNISASNAYIELTNPPVDNSTHTPTPTPSDTPTDTDIPSDTPMDTATNTPTATFTASDTPIPSATATDIQSLTPSNTVETLTPSATTCVKIATPPTLMSPPHRTHTTNPTPTFTWGAVTGAQSYRLMIYTEDRSFEFKKRVFNPTYTLTASEALAPSKYLWRVRTQDAGCNTWTAWSQRFTLFVE